MLLMCWMSAPSANLNEPIRKLSTPFLAFVFESGCRTLPRASASCSCRPFGIIDRLESAGDCEGFQTDETAIVLEVHGEALDIGQRRAFVAKKLLLCPAAVYRAGGAPRPCQAPPLPARRSSQTAACPARRALRGSAGHELALPGACQYRGNEGPDHFTSLPTEMSRVTSQMLPRCPDRPWLGNPIP